MPRTFHVQDELTFTRKDDGSVHLKSEFVDVVFTPQSWSSVVSSMSLQGENSFTYYETLVRQLGHL